MAAPTDRLRVALVCTAPANMPGSMQAYTQTLEHALRRFAPNIDARVLRIGSKGNEGNWARRAQTLLMLTRAWALRGFSPDIWHVLDGSRAYVASALRGAPVVITAHDLIPWLQAQGRFPGAPRTGLAARSLWRWNGRKFRASAALVCVSNNTWYDARDCFHVDAARGVVVPLPMRPTLVPFLPRSESFPREKGQVLHVGNNSFYKARERVLQIFACMDAVHARKLIMIGPEPTSDLRALATSLQISKRLQWISDPTDATLASHYHKSSLLLFPSRYEGFGWPVLEAMSFGLPVVCSDQGSLPEVAGPACPCINPDDVKAFAAAATAVLNNSLNAISISESGKRWAATHTEEQFAIAMRGVYCMAKGIDNVTRPMIPLGQRDAPVSLEKHSE